MKTNKLMFMALLVFGVFFVGCEEQSMEVKVVNEDATVKEDFYEESVGDVIAGKVVDVDEKLEEEKELVNDDLLLYVNLELGFEIKFPKKVWISSTWNRCEEDDKGRFKNPPERLEVPLAFFERGSTVYIAEKYYFEKGKNGECNEIENNIDLVIENYKKTSAGWKMTFADIAGDDALEDFVKEQYGQGCGVSGKKETKLEGVYNVEVYDETGEGMITGECALNYLHVLKYAPSQKRAVQWNIGQDCNFGNNSTSCLDGMMTDSFEFVGGGKTVSVDSSKLAEELTKKEDVNSNKKESNECVKDEKVYFDIPEAGISVLVNKEIKDDLVYSSHRVYGDGVAISSKKLIEMDSKCSVDDMKGSGAFGIYKISEVLDYPDPNVTSDMLVDHTIKKFNLNSVETKQIGDNVFIFDKRSYKCSNSDYEDYFIKNSLDVMVDNAECIKEIKKGGGIAIEDGGITTKEESKNVIVKDKVENKSDLSLTVDLLEKELGNDDDLIEYKNEKYNYSFKYPKDWYVYDNIDYGECGPEFPKGFDENVVILSRNKKDKCKVVSNSMGYGFGGDIRINVLKTGETPTFDFFYTSYSEGKEPRIKEYKIGEVEGIIVPVLENTEYPRWEVTRIYARENGYDYEVDVQQLDDKGNIDPELMKVINSIVIKK